MSFDLIVWHEHEPITAAEAEAKLDRYDEDENGVFHPHPAVAAIRAALLRRFPALEDLADEDLADEDPAADRGIWSVTPEPSDTVLELCGVWSRAGELATAVQALAAEHGLVCFDPGDRILDPNVPGYRPAFTLTSAVLPRVPDPDQDRVDRVVRRLGRDRAYAVLERDDGWYAQVGWGETTGARPGGYALEYREGAPDRHFRADTTDVTEAAGFLRAFLTGDEQWRRRLQWQPMTW